ncbi:penicillin-binding protein 1A [Thiohalospira sp.]|uniref:penicillin-binding protein 1A n=1 Tax=Thiohalospira sp. TaxID=3080549 RepID=UPI00397FEB23
MSALVRYSRRLVLGLAFLYVVAVAAGFAAYAHLAPGLPAHAELQDIELQVPLRIYSRDGKLIAEYGSQRRIPLERNEIPSLMVQAVMAAEDNRFYDHPGVDYLGLIRAAANLATTGDKSQGGSTITMQVARNFFLTREKTYLRKVREILLAFKIERELDKRSILELYLNKIYLGNRAYGIEAAAEVYYGVGVDELEPEQMAMIAGLPKAPSRYNPLTGSKRALVRRNYVLDRMHALGYLETDRWREARASGDNASYHGAEAGLHAPWIAELARQEMVARHGKEAYSGGYRVYTTVESRLQEAANEALANGLHDYSSRHGYRGPVEQRELDLDGPARYWLTTADEPGPLDLRPPQLREWRQQLEEVQLPRDLEPGLVVAVDERSARVITSAGTLDTIPWQGLSWARPYQDANNTGPEPESASDVVAVGDIVHLRPLEEGRWHLANNPEVQGAIVSQRPEDGSVLALAGGYDFNRSMYNRATQARRQPGSNFKPFIYSAALESGFTPASIINDAPVVLEDTALEGIWAPENYSGRFFGPTRLRTGLVKSRNLISIRLLRAMGIQYAINHATRFGFDRERLPRDLTLALGSGSITPLELATGYTVFANGGYRVNAHYLQRVEDRGGRILYEANPERVCPDCDEAVPEGLRGAEHLIGRIGLPGLPVPEARARRPAERVLPPENAYQINSMLRDVIKEGTGRGALALGRDDLAGKTGTTNQQVDAWFTGFNQAVATTSWIGFDNPRPLGRQETGARAALPMWRDFMSVALAGVPEQELERPSGMVTVRIDPETGRLAGPDNEDAIFETFRPGNVPEPNSEDDGSGSGDDVQRSLF